MLDQVGDAKLILAWGLGFLGLFRVFLRFFLGFSRVFRVFRGLGFFGFLVLFF